MELIDYITDLLIDFDEMGFAPTTMCPNPEAYAIEWRNKITKAFKELTEENESWQKELVRQKEIADKHYYDLACEVEDLRAENERYKAKENEQFEKWLKLEKATREHHSELFKEAKIAVKEDTVRKMHSMLCEGRVSNDTVVIVANQIAKEMVEGK